MGYRIVADDYGMSVEINHAILELVQKKIVSKVSVMANRIMNYSLNYMEELETGLHINFLFHADGTGIMPGKKISSLKFLYLIITGQISDNNIMDIIQSQFSFLKKKGIRISYLDTHQHIHIMPGILKLLIKFAKSNGISEIRCITIEKRHFIFYIVSLVRSGFLTQVPKMIVLYFMGMFMKIKLDRSGIHYCKNLVLMPLAISGDYGRLLKRLLKRFKDQDAEFVTHPSFNARTCQADDYSEERYNEYCSLLDVTGRVF